MATFTKKQIGDMQVLAKFIGVYCAARHGGAARSAAELPSELAGRFRKGLHLCPECAALWAHSVEKRRRCPLDPKPACKNCHIHCYSKEHRAKIREVMAFSGRRMIMRGRLDYLWKYLF
jgi:hypothetical protein